VTLVRWGAATDTGRVRPTNQDRLLASGTLFAVADGMGGHAGGEVAAQVAVESLQAAFGRLPSADGLRSAMAEANEAIWRQGQEQPALRGMGTTLTAAGLVSGPDGDVVVLANVGDSRAYVYSSGQAVQVTTDHSLAEEKVRHGELTEAEAAVHPHRHILTRALGVGSAVEADLWELHLRTGDRLVLCSDGLSNEVGLADMGRILSEVDDPQEAASRLVAEAIDHGGSDNVTVVVVDVVVGEEGPASAVVPLGLAGAGAAALLATSSPVAPPQVAPAPAPAYPGPPTEPAEPTGFLPSTAPPAGGSGAGPGGADPPGGPGGDLTGVMGAVGAAAVVADPGVTGVLTLPPEAGPGVTGVLPAATAPVAAFTDDYFSAGAGPVMVEPGPTPPGPGRESRRKRRRREGIPRALTLRVVLFTFLVAAVVVGGYLFLRWYATDSWYVTVDGPQLVIYQGRPGGLLWFHPKLVQRTAVTTAQVLPIHLDALRADVVEPSLTAARQYVTQLQDEYQSQQALANGGAPGGQGPNGTLPTLPPPTAPVTTTPPGSSTTAAPGATTTTGPRPTTVVTTTPTTAPPTTVATTTPTTAPPTTTTTAAG
jgi:protein phosphatase